MLVWPMAANEPSTIEAIETNTTICCHCADDAGKGADRRRARTSPIAATFGADGEEGGHRRRRALVDVRRPHVERHRRNLEAEAGEQEHQAEHAAPMLGLPCAACAMPAKLDRAGKAVNQRRAVEQHARGQRAEHEIFEAGFGRAHRVAVDRRDHVERTGSSARGRDRARSDRRPRSASACRASRAGSGSDTRTARCRFAA